MHEQSTVIAYPRHPWLVRRSDLIARLCRSTEARVLLVAAGAGYGKTTLLGQWAGTDRRRFARLALEEADNDPLTLVDSIGAALRAVDEPARGVRLDRGHPENPSQDGSAARLARRLCQRMEFLVLVLDDVHLVRAPGALAVLAALVDHLPAGSQVAFAARSEPRLPFPRWQVERQLLRLGPAELAMTPEEAGQLLRRAGVALDPDELELLVKRTEGWAAGLVLAALWLGEHGGQPSRAAGFGGSDRLVAGYLRKEVLDRLRAPEARLLVRTSFLDRLSAGVCNAVLQRSDSGAVLAGLERSNAFLVALDRGGEWYRPHLLFSDMLRAELRRQDPQLLPELHRRACRWHEEQGNRMEAVNHALAAHDVEHASRLIWSGLAAAVGSGSLDETRGQLSLLPEAEIAARPRLALALAWCRLQEGEPAAGELWVRTAEAAADGDSASAVSVRAAASALRAAAARDGVTRMGEDAAGCAEDDGPGPWRAMCCLLAGVSCRLQGQAMRAHQRFEEAERQAVVGAFPALAAATLGQQALLAVEEQSWEEAAGLAERAGRMLLRLGLSEQPWAAGVHAARAESLSRRGQATDAREAMREALRAVDTGPVPAWMAIEVRILLARSNLRLGDPIAARGLLAEAGRLLVRSPEAGLLRRRLEEVRQLAQAFWAAGLPGASALSRAELRILRFLPTHFSYREIAEQLHLSQCTVKTQVLAAFRKLEVSSRSEAVQRAQALGLISR
ncbi:MAG: hypothetical protein J2P45_16675 [Candidatus Dormibacteraeota bacterium]|nr:hypothetical protein [Candidatus Dormibacteraeota bacterium]